MCFDCPRALICKCKAICSERRRFNLELYGGERKEEEKNLLYSCNMSLVTYYGQEDVRDSNLDEMNKNRRLSQQSLAQWKRTLTCRLEVLSSNPKGILAVCV